jgi:hypothetical protein
MSNSINVIKSGLARCITEPRGRHGLEGYGLGQTYRFERCEDEKGALLPGVSGRELFRLLRNVRRGCLRRLF